ncbi:MAG: hypothetical protein KR126chlam6_00851 [Candidatus Anoxychlamydiales bacterium]|nr:hypothetical protein [Candidatus Anoxychlamydiales bacterium]
MAKKIPKSRAVFWIILSTFLISGFNFLIFSKVKSYKRNRVVYEKYNIKTIYQNPKNINLDVDYISELLNLSIDNPTNIFLFDENRALQNLLKNPVILNPSVKKKKPDCVFVDYDLRAPIAKLFDFDDVLIDENGYIFPNHKVFKNMNLCKIYLNLDEFQGYKKIDTKEAQLAIDILQKLKNSGFTDIVKITLLDTSRAFAQSYGKREIIMQVDEEISINKNQKEILFVFPKILRLPMNNYLEQISNYVALREKIIKDYKNQASLFEATADIVRFNPKTIDLRISKLAFIDQ